MQPITKQLTARFPLFRNVEHILCGAFLLLMAVLFLLEAILRKFKTSLGVSEVVINLVLWITFLAGMITSKEKKHMAISVGVELLKQPIRGWLDTFTCSLSFFICTILGLASLAFVILSYQWQQTVLFIPVQLILLIMPIGFSVIGFRFISLLKPGLLRGLSITIGLVLAIAISLPSLLPALELVLSPLADKMPPLLTTSLEKLYQINDWLLLILPQLAFIFIILLVISAFLGTPIFVVLGGLAIMLYTIAGSQLYAIPDEATIVLKGSIIPAIPLFTLVGFVLSESKAGERLVTLFKSLFGWIPGGLTIMSVLLCAFFTTLTGGSGVTILALGALLSFILENNRYSKNFSQGLITTATSTGLLFPPSIPVIMYGIIAQLDIKNLFVSGLLPGLLIVTLLILLGIFLSSKNKVACIPFSSKEAGQALKSSLWEIILPVLIIVGYFSGLTTLVETAALATVYIFCVEIFINKDLKPADIIRVFQKSLPVIGGVLIILAIARGLSSYLIINDVPSNLAAWVNTAIHSKYVFLLLLNLLLLITGCLMDVFSAILVVAPLVIPLGQTFGINSYHMAIIFLTNLEIGFLAPPVGINLLLSAYRFNVPLNTTFRAVMPFLLAFVTSLLLITYVPLLFYSA